MSVVILYNILCSTVLIQQGSIFPSHSVFGKRHHLNICILIPSMYLLVNVLFIFSFSLLMTLS